MNVSNQPQFIYITNPKHKLYGIGAFRIHFKTNGGYSVKFGNDWHQVDFKDGKELPNN